MSCLSGERRPICWEPRFRAHLVWIPNSMVTTSLTVEKNKGLACLAGIFKMACSWLSKQRWRAMLCKTTTRLSAEVGKYVFVHLLSPIFTNWVQWFAPTAAHVALWNSRSASWHLGSYYEMSLTLPWSSCNQLTLLETHRLSPSTYSFS